jgi:P2-related tail formation protein
LTAIGIFFGGLGAAVSVINYIVVSVLSKDDKIEILKVELKKERELHAKDMQNERELRAKDIKEKERELRAKDAMILTESIQKERKLRTEGIEKERELRFKDAAIMRAERAVIESESCDPSSCSLRLLSASKGWLSLELFSRFNT